MGFIRPQKPSFDELFNGFAAGEGCCCVVEGGLSCEPDVELPDPCAPADIASTDAKATIANWLGNKFRTALDLIKWSLF
jgi:hypothetical protein